MPCSGCRRISPTKNTKAFPGFIAVVFNPMIELTGGSSRMNCRNGFGGFAPGVSAMAEPQALRLIEVQVVQIQPIQR